MDAKKKLVKAAVSKGRDVDPSFTAAMRAFHLFLRKGSSENEDYDQAFIAHTDPLQKEIIESLILSKAAYEDVFTVFDITAKTLDTYKELFFDTAKLKTKLQLVSYIERLPPGVGKELKLRAVNLGPEYVYFTYGNAIPRTEVQKDLVRRMFMTSAYKAMSINYSTLDSKTSKNAMEHAKLMLKAYETMDKLLKDGGDAESEFLEIISGGTMGFSTMDYPSKKDLI